MIRFVYITKKVISRYAGFLLIMLTLLSISFATKQENIMGKIIEKIAEGRILISDGAWGTFLHKKGLKVQARKGYYSTRQR